mgnify:FL=1
MATRKGIVATIAAAMAALMFWKKRASPDEADQPTAGETPRDS